MVSRYMLDTNICIYIRRKRPTELLNRFRRLQLGEVVMSVVTYGELRYGADKSQERERALAILEDLVTLIRVEPMAPTVGAAYGLIRAALERRGEIIGNNDLWIAAHAKAAGLILVTNNAREFQRVSGLTVENWALL